MYNQIIVFHFRTNMPPFYANYADYRLFLVHKTFAYQCLPTKKEPFFLDVCVHFLLTIASNDGEQ